MKKEDWKKVAEIVSNALALDGIERGEYILEQTNRFPALKNEIESLIEVENEADSFFGSSAAFHFTDVLKTDETSANVGQKIGNYRILRELGTGGMGAVFLAERTDGEYNQKVAIKMLRREFNTSKIRHRFEKEKEIQAKLIHSNIARLMDAGTTSEGIPYFVMEYIEGTNIFDFIQIENLSLEKRLKLFNRVCDAVAFAHRNLIIHRDLKPSNIIVTRNGEPKLLDFGISKLLDEELNEPHTVTKMGVMTPEYASPEQVKGESVSTATDIYSLGVILFEILTGQRPFAKEARKSGNLFKAITEKEPERPSDILSQILSADIPPAKEKDFTQKNEYRKNEPKTQILSEAKTRKLIDQTRPQFINTNPRQLRGDLDNIILKSLRKEPGRRYQTVEQFSADIWRHLDGLPVSARPATFSYRASKFIRRNRLGVAAAGFIVLTILSGLFATFWQARQAEIQRAKAEKRFNDVRQLANSILFKVYPTVEKLEGSIEARKAIVENAKKYLDSLSKEASDNTELQLELAQAYIKIGDVQGNNKYPNLGDLKGSLNSYAKAKLLIQNVYNKNQNNLDLKNDLANVLEKEGFVFWWSGDNQKTYQFYDQSLNLRKDLIDKKPNSAEYKLSLASLYLDYGDVPYWENKNEEADKYYQLALGILENLSKENEDSKEIQATYAHSFNRLSKVDVRLAEYKEAIKNLQIAEGIYREMANKNPTEQKLKKSLWATQFGICEVYLFEENAEKAVNHCPNILEIQKRFVENEPNNATAKFNLTTSYYYLSEAYLLGNKFDDGLQAIEKGLELIGKNLKKTPKNLEYRHLNLSLFKTRGKIFSKKGDLQNARITFERHIAGYEKMLEENPKDSRAKVNLFKSYADIGKITTHQTAKQWFGKSFVLGQELLKAKALNEEDKKILKQLESDLKGKNSRN